MSILGVISQHRNALKQKRKKNVMKKFKVQLRVSQRRKNVNAMLHQDISCSSFLKCLLDLFSTVGYQLGCLKIGLKKFCLTFLLCHGTLCINYGGFQLLDLIIPELKSHVIPYKFKSSHWLKLQHSDWRANLVKDFFYK